MSSNRSQRHVSIRSAPAALLAVAALLKKRETTRLLIGAMLFLVTAGYILLTAAHISVTLGDKNINRFHIFPVGVGYAKLAVPLVLLAQGSSVFIIMEMFAYCILAISIGCYLLEKFFDASGSLFLSVLLFLSGFIPGYLILIGINRIVSFVLPNGIAAPVLAAIYIVVVLYCFLHQRGCRSSTGVSAGVFTRDWKGAIGVLAPLATIAMIVLFLIYQVQTDNAHIIGDGALFFLNLVRSHTSFSSATHFPVITQHYDEIMFLYPIFQSNSTEMRDIGNAINCYWMLYAFGKAACFSIIVVSVHSLSNSKLLGVLCAALLFFGSLHPNPFTHLWLFDARNPLGVNLHIGRIILAIMPVAIIAIAQDYARLPTRLSKENVVILLMLGIGLSSLSLHVTIVVTLSLVMAALLFIRIDTQAAAFIIGICLCTIIALYASPATMSLGIGFLIVYVIMISLLILHIISRLHVMGGRSWRTLILNTYVVHGFALFLGIGASLLFLGNSMVITHYPFSLPAPIFLTRPMSPVPMGIGRNPLCGIGYIGHCGNIIAFTMYYGLPFILLGICALTALFRDAIRPITTIPGNAVLGLFGILPFMSAGLVLSFLMYDFLDADSLDNFLGVWLKTRLLEPWFYGCIIMSLVFLWKGAAFITKSGLALLLLTYIMGQSLLSEREGVIGQLTVNFRYIQEHVLSLSEAAGH